MKVHADIIPFLLATSMVVSLANGAGLQRTAATRLLDHPEAEPMPALVTLLFHHSTSGIYRNVLPRLSATGDKATLGLVVMEFQKTRVSPLQVSTPAFPGGMGNVQPISLGAADADGYYAGRKYLEFPGGFMTEAEVVSLTDAGWELAYHGIDHTPQTAIVGQVDGPGKLGRAYETGTAEILRLLAEGPLRTRPKSLRIQTNTLPSNAWDARVREVAWKVFDWTEVLWNGSPGHVPIAYGQLQDPHGSFNSIAFSRDTYDGPQDLDDLVRLVRGDGGGWLVIQLHDVVEDLSLSPHPPTAMLTDEFDGLLQSLQAAGVRLVTFEEGAALVHLTNSGNRLRNGRYGVHPFLARTNVMPMDWSPYVAPVAGARLTFLEDGSVEMSSDQAPAAISLVQAVGPELRGGRRLVVRARVNQEGMQGGRLRFGLSGFRGEFWTEVESGQEDICIDMGVGRVAERPGEAAAGDVQFRIVAENLLGEVVLSDLSLLSRPRRQRDCEPEEVSGSTR